MWRRRRQDDRFPARRSQRVKDCRLGIWSRFYSRSCATASLGASAARTADTIACERNGVTVNDILRAAGIGDEEELKSEIVTKVVLPVLSPAEQALGQALNQISLNDIVRYAESMVTKQVGTKAA